MAKSNLKTINNNSITQGSHSQVFSKKSFTNNLYIYLNLLSLFKCFSLNLFAYKIKNRVTYNYFKNFKYINTDRFRIQSAKWNYFNTSVVKLYNLNGLLTFYFDYCTLYGTKSRRKGLKSIKSSLFRNIVKKEFKFFKLNIF